MIHLRSIDIKPAARSLETFPFTLPLVRQFAPVEFSAPVTFFAGENGSGKSTLLEAIAAATRLPAAGSAAVDRDDSLEAARALGAQLRCAWAARVHRGFFMRAEDFLGFTRHTQKLMKELEAEAARHQGDSYGARLARGSILGQRAALANTYGENPDAHSHGESFLALFRARFVPRGVYLLDEPEMPLSPLRQLAFLSLLKQYVEHEAGQFIIATHSPILLAYPGAAIYSFDGHPLKQVAYDDLESVSLTRAFLRNPTDYLHRL